MIAQYNYIIHLIANIDTQLLKFSVVKSKVIFFEMQKQKIYLITPKQANLIIDVNI